jgi:SAM-dependent methyltransferase
MEMRMRDSIPPKLAPFLAADAEIAILDHGIPGCKVVDPSPGLKANRDYFSNPIWAKTYLDHVHRDAAFRQRWLRATQGWDGLIVVDLGCGPGNLGAALGGKPAMLLGVDISLRALNMAQEIGYTPLHADAHDLPLVSGFADIVAINATLHHCDDMYTVLAAGARLVKPGGLLITDHDPQLTAYDFRGPGLWLWNLRVPLYRMLRRGGHANQTEQSLMLATEVHHNPGDGVVAARYREILEPLGFEVQLYFHNNLGGAEVLDGEIGRAKWKVRAAQLLSGMDVDSPTAAITLMCIARRRAATTA